MKSVRKTLWKPQAILSVLLLWALNDANPYGYYVFLRLVCCGVFAYLALRAARDKREGWAWTFGLVALLYNPFIWVHLDRSTWSAINGATVVLALVSIVVLRPSSPQPSKSNHSQSPPA